ncbi:hypothetical protein ILUMI_22797 [Ignelater luminosus]|uniref:Protein LTV1 homolog n=1 Tax=Ignelater luminosus TaxID=2038154 RepID=A0A8K0CC36_IGNLU|nr:hypothetical protein ILUMI_22797 [Ignelater luminosus]
MPKKSRKFIDRKNAVTFHLVHRSQQDPLAADESAPQRVLLPVQESSNKPPKEKEKRIDEQHKYGIFFDDDYNYLQHLRDVDNTAEWVQVDANTKSSTQPKLQLPSSVFASNVEEEVGLLNKAAPHSGLRLDLDPDVVAAMDDDFNYDDPENELEDNFMELANAEGSEEEYEDEECEEEEDEHSDVSSESYGSEAMDEVGSLDGSQYTFRDEETKSRFTEYSMSSSVMRRNEQLTLLDDRFEQIYSGYDDSEIGALDCDEIEGYVPETSEVLLQYADEFQKERQREHLDKDALALRLKLQECDTDSGNENELVEMEVTEKEKWDCESILSTYSNIYNHPKLITDSKQPKIKINTKTGMPVNVLNSGKLTAKALSKLDEQNDNCRRKGPESVGAQSITSTLSTLSIRPKDESPEQKKDRKKLLKEYRKERRQEKKLNTLAFKEETKRQIKIGINNKNNVQGNRIL